MRKWVNLLPMCMTVCILSACSYNKIDRLFGEESSQRISHDTKTDASSTADTAEESSEVPEYEPQNAHAYVPVGEMFSPEDVSGETWLQEIPSLYGNGDALKHGVFYLGDTSFWYFVPNGESRQRCYAGKTEMKSDGTLLLAYENMTTLTEDGTALQTVSLNDSGRSVEDLVYANETNTVLSVCFDKTMPIRTTIPLFQRSNAENGTIEPFSFTGRSDIILQQKTDCLVTEQASYVLHSGSTPESFQLDHMLTPEDVNTNFSLVFSDDHICRVNGGDLLGQWSMHGEHLLLLYDMKMEDVLFWFYVDFAAGKVDWPLYVQQDALLELCESVSVPAVQS